MPCLAFHRACAAGLLGFDDPLVAQPCPAPEFGDDILRGCFEEVEARLVGADEDRAQIADLAAFAAHRRSGGARSVLQIGDVPARDVRLDQVGVHSLDATPTSAVPKWRNP
jgi:hypothetical protein